MSTIDLSVEKTVIVSGNTTKHDSLFSCRVDLMKEGIIIASHDKQLIETRISLL
jgi:hypothetical protein